MTHRGGANLAASVRQRLKNQSDARNEDFQFVLTRYAVERLLYRLSRSPHAERFVLKGAMLLHAWSRQPYRPTRDLDLLGHGENSPSALLQVFRDICEQPVEDDGIEFRPETVQAELINEDKQYEGVRLCLLAFLDRARLHVQVDIGFGDAVTPGPEMIDYPTLLDSPTPRIAAYNRESVVAEKYQAMVTLGMANSRLKDFYDLCDLARRFEFQGRLLAEAIGATFLRRRTELPSDVPTALTDEFSRDPGKQAQWGAFVHRNGLSDGPNTLDDVAQILRSFLIPPTQHLRCNKPFDRRWPPTGPWA